MGHLGNLRMVAGMLPYMKDFMAVGALSLGQLAARFSDPLLSTAIANVMFDESMPAMALVMTLAPMSQLGRHQPHRRVHPGVPHGSLLVTSFLGSPDPSSRQGRPVSGHGRCHLSQQIRQRGLADSEEALLWPVEIDDDHQDRDQRQRKQQEGQRISFPICAAGNPHQ